MDKISFLPGRIVRLKISIRPNRTRSFFFFRDDMLPVIYQALTEVKSVKFRWQLPLLP